MKYTTIILLCYASAYVLFKVSGIFLGPKRHVRALLAQHPGAEQTSVFLPSHPTIPRRRVREVFTKIAEMKPQGWTYLRGIRSQGGMTLLFIRTDD